MNTIITRANNTLRNALKVAATTALVSAVTGAIAADKSWELSEHQKGLLGPKKHDMTEADYSGTVNADPMWMADRLAILNTITAYSYLIDEGRWDQWYELFAEDVVFESTVPCFGSITAKNRVAMKGITDLRYGAKTTTMRRHFQSNVHVTEQTATTAKARTYMLITAVPASTQLTAVTSGTYNANLEKRNGKWIITRWYIEVDASIASSPMPANLPADLITFIPDTRPECAKK